jgi:hypothetical protein
VTGDAARFAYKVDGNTGIAGAGPSPGAALQITEDFAARDRSTAQGVSK